MAILPDRVVSHIILVLYASKLGQAYTVRCVGTIRSQLAQTVQVMVKAEGASGAVAQRKGQRCVLRASLIGLSVKAGYFPSTAAPCTCVHFPKAPWSVRLVTMKTDCAT